MSTYKRKTRDVWELWINYGQGWEHEITEDSWKEMRERLKEYRENCPEYPVKSRKRRERIADEQRRDAEIALGFALWP